MRFDRRTFLSIILVFTLVILNIAITNLLSPVFDYIMSDFHIVDANQLGLVDGPFLVLTAISALGWGFTTDKIDRIRVLFFSSIVWTVGTFLTGMANSFEMLIICRAVTGIGVGSILPLSYSIVGDLVREEERAGIMGTLAIISSLSNGLARIVGGFLAPSIGWRSPFLFFAIICAILIPFLKLVTIPHRAKTETVFKDLTKEFSYNYTIRLGNVKEIAYRKKSNFYLLIQGFLSIIPGTTMIYFLVRLFDMQYFLHFPDDVRKPTASLMGGLIVVGYFLGNIILSAITDKSYKRNRRNRALIALICTVVVVPITFIAYFLVEPVDYLSLGASTDATAFALVGLILQKYPIYWGYLIVGNVASFFSTGFTFNRDSTMVDVNLPEHRGTAGSLYTFTEQVGKGVTEFLGWGLIWVLGSMNIIGAMEILTLFWIPCIPLWYIVMKHVKEDIATKERILGDRLALLKSTNVKE